MGKKENKEEIGLEEAEKERVFGAGRKRERKGDWLGRRGKKKEGNIGERKGKKREGKRSHGRMLPLHKFLVKYV